MNTTKASAILEGATNRLNAEAKTDTFHGWYHAFYAVKEEVTGCRAGDPDATTTTQGRYAIDCARNLDLISCDTFGKRGPQRQALRFDLLIAEAEFLRTQGQ